MKRNKLYLFTLLTSSSLLLSCSNASVTLEKNQNRSINQNSNSANSIQEAINKLIDSKNYTIEVTSQAGPLTIKSNVYYTDYGFYDDYLGDEYGFCQVNEGVFSFDLYQRKFTASNLLKDEDGNIIKDLWSSSLFNSFASLRKQEFEKATGTEFTTSSKRVKLPLMNLFKINQAYYPAVEDITFKLNGNTIDGMTFTISVKNGQSYDCVIKDFGKTSIKRLDDYLASNQSYVEPSKTLAQVIDLFKNFNYTRIIYDDDTEGFTKIAGYEFYDENYFYTEFAPSAIAAGKGYNIGVVSVNKHYDEKIINGTSYGPYDLVGSYYCSISHSLNQEPADGELYTVKYSDDDKFDIMTSFPINSDPYVPNVYNYPTFLKIFDSTQYLKVSGAENKFYTSKTSCIIDFINNFQASSISESGLNPTGVFVEYYPEGLDTYAGTVGKETVVFKLEVSYYGALQTIDYIYTDFNKTNISLITDESITKIIDAKVQAIYDKAQGNGDEQ